MTFTTLAITLAFVCIPLVLSKALNLQLGKDVIIATIRAIVQLLAIGYVLQLIFDQQNVVFSFLMVAIMIAVATLNARKKGAQINGITWKLALSLCVIEAIVMSVLVGFHIVPATAQYIIPLSGMAIGNSMVMSILFLNRFTAEIEAHEQEVELIYHSVARRSRPFTASSLHRLKRVCYRQLKAKKRLVLYSYQV